MAFRPLQEYKIVVDGGATAEAALAIPLPVPPLQDVRRMNMQLSFYAKNTDIVVKLGGSTVTADATVTSQARVARNFTIPQGAIILINLQQDETYISCIAEDESTTTGILIVTLGYGE